MSSTRSKRGLNRSILVHSIAEGTGLAAVRLIPWFFMAKKRERVVFLGLYLLVGFAGVGIAGDAFSGFGTPGPSKWSVTEGPNRGFPLTIVVSTPGVEAIAVDEGYVLRTAQSAGIPAGGRPDLPVAVKVVRGVPGYRAVLEDVECASREARDVRIAPAATVIAETQPDGKTPLVKRRVADTSIYGQAGFWPESMIRVEEAWMGTQKLVRITAWPVQYDPSAETVRFNQQITARIGLVPEDTEERNP